MGVIEPNIERMRMRGDVDGLLRAASSTSVASSWNEAVDALVSLGLRAVPALVTALRQPKRRGAAVHALTGIGTPAIGSIVGFAEIGDVDSETVDACLEVLDLLWYAKRAADALAASRRLAEVAANPLTRQKASDLAERMEAGTQRSPQRKSPEQPSPTTSAHAAKPTVDVPRETTTAHASPEGDDPSVGTRRIRLTQGQFALVDAEDYGWLSKWKWHAQKWHSEGEDHYYANRRDPVKKTAIGMHRQIMGFPEGLEVDHINGNSLDNRRCNLRAVSTELNQINSSTGWGSSRFRGVTWDASRGLWKAHATLRDVRYQLGHFPTEEAAARAVDRKRREVYGEYARPLIDDPEARDEGTLF